MTKANYARNTYLEVRRRAQRFRRDLNETLGREKILRKQLKLMAMLAADTPQFYDPLTAMVAKTLRDQILAGTNVP